MSKQNQNPTGDKPRSYTSVQQMPDHATEAKNLPGYAATPVDTGGNTVDAKAAQVRAALADRIRRGY